jgi:folate-dependent tRNA-U54 methylase TrmFO/GidA
VLLSTPCLAAAAAAAAAPTHSLTHSHAPFATHTLALRSATGYEEAAAQGLVAGLNAARRAQDLEPVTLPRESSYVGTLLDDLVTKDLREPYRMLTSRQAACIGTGAYCSC